MVTGELSPTRADRGDWEPARHVPYRTAFETPLDLREATERVREQLRSWIKSKSLDVAQFDAGAPTVGTRAVVLYAATNTASGWQLRERADGGVTWVSNVAVTRGNGRSAWTWVSVTVEAVAAAGRTPAYAAPPRLIRLLLDAIDAYDGEVPLRSRPTVTGAAGVDDLLELICAEERRLPIVVASPPPDVEFEEWRRTVGRIMADLPGLASMYLLNPGAVQEFNSGIGTTHWIGPGAIRTYLPGVDPAVDEDAVRHRVLGRRRIDSEPNRARRLLAALPRQLAANSLPPAATRGLDLSIGDFARRAVHDVPGDGDVKLRDQIRLMEALLDTADASERQMKETINRQQEELLDLAADLEVARDELESRDATIRTLRRRLLDAKRYEDAFAPTEAPQPLPKSFGEVLDRLTLLTEHVVFTGDIDECLDLDEHAQSSTWAQTGWQAILAFRDYANAKAAGEFGGDFKMWCESPANGGRVVSLGKVARDESETVRNSKRKFAPARMFPVPNEIEPSGKIFMGAHIRLGHTSTVAPRLYFHDASTVNGVIYIGYIGRHLANTLTS